MMALDIHDAIDRPDPCAENDQRRDEQRDRGDRREQRQGRADQHAADDDHAPAAEPRGQGAGNRHGDDGPDAQAEQQPAQARVIEAGAELREDHEGRPGGAGKSGDEEGDACRQPGRCARGKQVLAGGRSHSLPIRGQVAGPPGASDRRGLLIRNVWEERAPSSARMTGPQADSAYARTLLLDSIAASSSVQEATKPFAPADCSSVESAVRSMPALTWAASTSSALPPSRGKAVEAVP